MGKQFNVPGHFRSPVISVLKRYRQEIDPRKRDLRPSDLDFGAVRFKIARHFGFCFGVENAVELAYDALTSHPDKRIFLLSEMIHNPRVNADLESRGIRFLRDTDGTQRIPFDALGPDDIVIVPAFGTTLEIADELASRGIDIKTYDTTCPFVVKVWKRSGQIGAKGFTVVVHGKRYHEETRATFSHASMKAPVVVVRDLAEAKALARIIRGEEGPEYFISLFSDRISKGFNPEIDLERIGVVNQTTMLASETHAIAQCLKSAISDRYGEKNLPLHYADNSDTLCYATNENQDATRALIEEGGDLAIIVGGYNSSNTSHLVELCEAEMATYFVSGPDEIEDRSLIHHFDVRGKRRTSTQDWLPERQTVPSIVLTSGASCPDALLEEVLHKVLGFFSNTRPLSEVLAPYEKHPPS